MLSVALRSSSLSVLLLGIAIPISAQTSQPTAPAPPPPAIKEPTPADLLRGSYGPYRANNDLLFYHLDLRVNPEKKFISGSNTIRFKMLADGTRIQLELFPTLQIDKIEMGKTSLKYERDGGTFFVDFPKPLRTGHTYSIDVHYSGSPVETGRFGCFTFKQDTSGHPWINTACEETGASVWWPNKDQWRDEPQDGMEINIAVPNGLMDVSNGKFIGKKDLGDGYTRWDWKVHYSINNYDVALNIGNYVHFDDKFGDLPLDYYVLPEDLDGAKRQFAQVPGMMKAYYHYFGEYPFKKDGYKLIEVPYAGMEHQSAVAYGNHFHNGYLDRDWTGVGISPRFDFIIIHESGHEWFGNAITAADKSDMWIHEGWTTYLECLYVEYNYGHEDEVKYVNALKKKVKNDRPIITAHGTNAEPPQDQYFKGALFINTLRSIVDDDARWFALIHDFYQHFEYQNIMTEDVEQYFNQQTGMNLTPVFDQYLRHTAIPALELKFDEAASTVQYRWKADEKAFAMPVRVGLKEHWETIHPTTEWQTMKTPLTEDQFEVATDLYYITVDKLAKQ
ncbi:M1 family metallopeptidase [Tunturiibacter gelidoferens]|uniref:Aminopeptidase N n=1 Tax=Tunturiibacter gelidiferens TaxID=3069689 RepID=A0ACC5P1H0_9BACT|nr:M1 family metallopeptidase [Edaphobacter lichenicola]MBB5340556.1 aminopeptidase N [Edaphobacter lichenicola]